MKCLPSKQGSYQERRFETQEIVPYRGISKGIPCAVETGLRTKLAQTEKNGELVEPWLGVSQGKNCQLTDHLVWLSTLGVCVLRMHGNNH